MTQFFPLNNFKIEEALGSGNDTISLRDITEIDAQKGLSSRGCKM